MNTGSKRITIFQIMKLLNLTVVIFLSLVMCISLEKISISMHAKEFLQSIEHMPPVPWLMPVVSIGACLLLIFAIDIQRFEIIPQWACISVQIVLGFVVIYALQMNYNGIILLIAAGLIEQFKDQKDKLIFLAGICLFILIFDYHICENFMRITSFETCIQYYRNVVSSVLIAGKNTVVSVNIILFIIYTVFLLREQIDENVKIHELNEQLNNTNLELQRANTELEIYARETAKMAETKERNRLAREIHDTLGHTLTGIIAGIDAAIAIQSIAPEQSREQLEMIGDVARQGMTDVRRSVSALRPDVLEKEELLSAIEHTVKEMAAASRVDINFTNDAGKLIFNEDEEEIIYRIIQESITNSIRHGKASQIDIHIKREYSVITITVKDNGIGTDEISYGFGFTHMKERLDMIKGDLYLESKDGFLVVAKIPIRWGETND